MLIFLFWDSLTDTKQGVTLCGQSVQAEFHVNVASDARFFVATGVLSMLWAMAALFIYLFMEDLYQNDKKIPLAVCLSIPLSHQIDTNM